MAAGTRVFRLNSITRCALLFLSLACVVPAVLAQDVSEEAVSVFAPFVSRIRLSTRDPEVRLSWQDSEDVSGSYSVYRHTSPITADTFRLATLVAEVEPGVQSFIDAPDTPGNYYYAVIAKSAAGETYEVFIPYRNTTSNAVTVANTATVVEQAARVREIAAFEETGSILVEFEADQVGRDLIIYRSTKPFVAGSDLLAAGVVATLPSTLKSTVDYPVPGVPYYYGVVDAALVEDGSVTFVPGENATTEPVEIPLVTAAAPDPVPETTVEREPEPADDPAVEQPVETAQASTTVSADPPASASASTADQPFSPTVVSRRPLPLPFLQLNTDLETGRRIGDANIVVPDPQPVSSNTRGAIETLLAGLTGAPTSAAEPVILPDDTLTDPRGAEYTLRTILDGPFKGLAWEDALLQLNNFLTLPLSDEIRSRAVFYRAQCYYFTGDTQRAFVEFLLARGRYFTEVEEWLDTILSSTGA